MSAEAVPGGAIRVTVNGAAGTWPAGSTLGSVVAALVPSRAGVAAAVGECVVPRAEWDARALREGDEIEILTAVQGG